MNGRKAKLLRKQNTEEAVPQINMSWGPNRKSRRSRYVERGYTRPGMDVVSLVYGVKVHRKLTHVINDYRLQREVLPDTNKVRFMFRKAARQAMKELAKNGV